MSEVKAMNLTGVSHNPLSGDAARGSVSANMREGAKIQLAKQQMAQQKSQNQQQMLMAKSRHQMAQKMQAYQITAMNRAEEDYKKKKQAENYVYSHYPKMADRTLEDYMTNGLSYGDGSYDKQRAAWVKGVGNHSWGAFEKHHANNKAMEIKSLQRSMAFDPFETTEKQHNKKYSDLLGQMTPEDRTRFLNSMDGQTQAVFKDMFPSQNTVGERWDNFKTDTSITFGSNPIKTALGGTAAIIAIGAGLRNQPAKALKWLWSTNGKVTADMSQAIKNSSIKLNTSGTKLGTKGTEATKGLVDLDDLDLLEKKGLISKAQRKILEDGGSVVPDALRKEGLKKQPIVGPPENLVVNHKNVKYVTQDIDKMIKDGVINEADGVSLKRIIDDILKSGDELTGENIGKAIGKGGDKYKGLAKNLARQSATWMGGISMAGVKSSLGGFLKGSLIYGGGAYAGKKLAPMLGFDGESESGGSAEIGARLGAEGTVASVGMVKVIQSKIKTHGMQKVLARVAQKGGTRLALSLLGKGAISATGVGSAVGLALLSLDAYAIIKILQEMKEE